MEKTEFIWHNGKLVPWDEAKIHVLTHALHYGSGVFEGLRMYDTERGPAIFRLHEHIERLFYSAGVLEMPCPYTPDAVIQATLELVRKNKLPKGYIRPVMFFGYGRMGVNPTGVPVELAIACWPWGAYLPAEMVDIKISKYIRIHPQTTVCDAKITGHYVNGILSIYELKGTKYHESLLLDYNGNIAEGPGENLFIVNNGVIYTPKLGTILAGITRKTVIELAHHFGYKVIEKDIKPEEAFAADEAFFTGTAAEVTPIRTIDDKLLADGRMGPISRKLRDYYQDVVHGRAPEFVRYLTVVNQT